MGETVLEVKNLTKKFGQVTAVNNMSVSFEKGEIHSIIGENGSGKSTLANMIAGILKPNEGTMLLKGETYTPKNIIDAGIQKVSMLVQEQRTIGDLSIAENIFLGKETIFSKSKTINTAKIKAESKKVLASVGLEDCEVELPMSTVSFEDRKLIEVGISLYSDPEILIFDETTTALSMKGRDTVYKIMRRYKDEGKTVILISHNMEEVREYSDRVTVMRDGDFIKTLSNKQGEITEDNMRMLMIGRDISGNYYRSDKVGEKEFGEVVLEVKNVSLGNVLHDVSFELRKGEILGLGGLTDCGMHELCKIIFGAIKPDVGTVTYGAEKNVIKSPGTAIKNKMAYLSKNRDQESLMLGSSIKDNIVATAADRLTKKGYISTSVQKKIANEMSKELSIKTSGIDQLCIELSGGNKQKVVIAKWLANESETLIMDCPTRGIDIGVKDSIYSMMEDLTQKGCSIIMVSEEMPELIGMSDRIIVLRNGRVSGEFQRSELLSEQDLIRIMV